jgi:uncharacterized membrane protein YphA (DoxX/SURF4 family)
MSVVRRFVRPLLAATFIETGLSTLHRPGPRADQVRPVVAQVAGPLRLPAEPETFLRVDGAVTVTAGTLLAFGRVPQLAALALVAGAAPAVYGEIAHWRDKDPEQRRARRSELLTRLGLIGGALEAAQIDRSGSRRPGGAPRRCRRSTPRTRAPTSSSALRCIHPDRRSLIIPAYCRSLLLAAVDTAGRPELAWRSRQVGRRAGREARRAVERTRRRAAAATRRDDARE